MTPSFNNRFIQLLEQWAANYGIAAPPTSMSWHDRVIYLLEQIAASM